MDPYYSQSNAGYYSSTGFGNEPNYPDTYDNGAKSEPMQRYDSGVGLNPYEDDATVVDPAQSGDEANGWPMERRDSGRSDLTLCEDDRWTTATVTGLDQSPDDVNDMWRFDGYPSTYIKQEPQPHGTVEFAQLLVSTEEEIQTITWQATLDATSLLNNNSFRPLYITTDAVMQRAQSTKAERQVVQDILYEHLYYCSKNEGNSPDPTVLLVEAACQMQFHIEGGLDIQPGTQWICYYAILCVLGKLRGVDKVAAPETHRASGKSSSSSSEKVYACRVPECNNRVFGRSADLERHNKMIHTKETEKKPFYCDYKKCPRHKTAFFRQDHFRDHLRDQHKEDLIRRSVKPDQAWWESRNHRSLRGWWRCNRCLAQRVDIATSGYSCPACGNSCEPERKRFRESVP